MVLKEILITLYHYELQSTTNTQLTTPSKNRIVMRFGVQQALITALGQHTHTTSLLPQGGFYYADFLEIQP